MGKSVLFKTTQSANAHGRLFGVLGLQYLISSFPADPPKILGEKLFYFLKLVPMSITHVPSLQFLPAGKYGLCFGYYVSGPLLCRSHNRQLGHLLWGQIWESLVLRLHSKFGQIHLSIEASVTTTGTF